VVHYVNFCAPMTDAFHRWEPGVGDLGIKRVSQVPIFKLPNLCSNIACQPASRELKVYNHLARVWLERNNGRAGGNTFSGQLPL
jgi:hypothetical protein